MTSIQAIYGKRGFNGGWATPRDPAGHVQIKALEGRSISVRVRVREDLPASLPPAHPAAALLAAARGGAVGAAGAAEDAVPGGARADNGAGAYYGAGKQTQSAVPLARCVQSGRYHTVRSLKGAE